MALRRLVRLPSTYDGGGFRVTPRSRGAAAALALMLAAALAACGSDDATAGDDPTPSASSSTASSSASPAESEPPAATGPALSSDHLALRLPADATWETSGVEHAYWYAPAGGTWEVHITDQVPVGWDLASLERATRKDLKRTHPALRRLPDRTVAGEPWFVLASDTAEGYLVEVGGVRGQDAVTVTFDFPRNDDRATAWIDAVLAGVRWR